MDLSIVIPIYNEEDNIPILLQSIEESLRDTNLEYEIICVDDGSQDCSLKVLKRLATVNPRLRVIVLRRNYGQTAAMAAGFENSRGRFIVTLDGDLQNDPADIPLLLKKLQEGYDLVSGWRQNRQDDTLTRVIPSKVANWLISRITGVELHDYGCSLKAYRKELIDDLNLYGELHRFLPVLAYIEGAKITEIPVKHHPRRFGKSKYGLGRTFRVILDLFTLFFLKKFLTRPMHVFGFFGLISLLLGVTIGTYLSFLKLVLGQSIGDRPLLILSVLLVLAGVQLFSFGLLAELLIRTYHESQKRPIYRIREVYPCENNLH